MDSQQGMSSLILSLFTFRAYIINYFSVDTGYATLLSCVPFSDHLNFHTCQHKPIVGGAWRILVVCVALWHIKCYIGIKSMYVMHLALIIKLYSLGDSHWWLGGKVNDSYITGLFYNIYIMCGFVTHKMLYRHQKQSRHVCYAPRLLNYTVWVIPIDD